MSNQDFIQQSADRREDSYAPVGQLAASVFIRSTLVAMFLGSLLVVPAGSSAGPSTSNSLREITAVRIEESVQIDAVLDESVWHTTPITQFFQMEPNQGEPVTEKTEVWIAYDDDALYIAAMLHDSHPDSIAARLTRKDEEQMYGLSDEFDVYLDPYHDHRTGFFFCVTAPGSLRDGVLDNDGRFDQSWDGVWESKTRITGEGWIVEMKVPFSQVRFKDEGVHEWGIDIERDIIRKGEQSFLAYPPRGESGFVSRFVHLKGLERIPPPSRLEVLPYATTKAEYLDHAPGDPFNNGSRYTPGVGFDMKYGLGSNLTLDGTVNPDFGQVEVDPAVVNLSDIETFYPEKRPFFIEGINIFRFGSGGTNRDMSFKWSNPTIFYSRRIGMAPQGKLPQYEFADIPPGVHILGAGKITGKINEWNIGTLHGLTKREYAEIENGGDRSSVEVEPLAYYGVVRAEKIFDQGRQGVGVISTFVNRFFNDQPLRSQFTRNSLVMGIDGWTFLDDERTYVVTGWGSISRVAGSQARMIDLQRNPVHYFQRPDARSLSVDSTATSLTGYAGRVMLNKQRGDVMLNAALGVINPGYETNDLGYLSRSDLINAHLSGGYRWLTPTGLYRSIVLLGAVFSSWDYDRNQTAKGAWGDLYVTFPDFSYVELLSSINATSLNNRLTRGGPLTLSPSSITTTLNFGTDNRKWWVVSGRAETVNGAADKAQSYAVELQLKLSSNVCVTLGPEYQRLTTKAQWVSSYEDQTADTYGWRYLFASLDQNVFDANVRINWILSPTLSVQLYVQPLVASGNYSEFKSLSRPRSFDFTEYGLGPSTTSVTIKSDGSKSYTFDADGNGASPSYTIPDPDFSIVSLRGNVVIRWEFMPGSAVYLVWTQSRSAAESIGDFRFGHAMGRLWDVTPDNIFMAKVSYWLSL
jgi:hypothetical protein